MHGVLLASCGGCLSQGLESASLKHEQIRDVTAFYIDEEGRVVAVEAIALHDGKGPPRQRMVLYNPAAVEMAIDARMKMPEKHLVRDQEGRKIGYLHAPEAEYLVLPESIFVQEYDAREVPARLAEMRRIDQKNFVEAAVSMPHGVERGKGIVIRRGGEDVFLVADAQIYRSQRHPISPLVAFPTAIADVLTSPIQAAMHAYWWAAMHE